MKPLDSWPATAVASLFLALLAAERARPLRRCVETKLRRVVRNVTLGGIWAAALAALQVPLLVIVAQWCAGRHIGLLNLVALPRLVEITLAVVLLDYTLWLWHWANHRIPLLWRFHLVHHVDLDLDASTGLRFHLGEMLLSIPYRLSQTALIGADVSSVNLFQTVLMLSVLFHHSNMRLPYGLERRLVRFVVTPRMHGIHHSTRRHETDSNYSSFLSAWDYLHHTVRLNVPQDAITIGVPAYQRPGDVTLLRLLALPFRRRGDDWAGAVRPVPAQTAAHASSPAVLLA